MSALPPWFWLLCALLLFSALAGWVLHRGIKKQVQAVQGDVQAQSNRDIQRQHLAELDRSLAEGRLTSEQHAMARDELLLLVQGDVARATPSAVGPNVQVRLSGLVLTLAVLSGLTYIKLGAPNTWWPLPLSQRVQITAGKADAAMAAKSPDPTGRCRSLADTGPLACSTKRLCLGRTSPGKGAGLVARARPVGGPRPDESPERGGRVY